MKLTKVCLLITYILMLLTSNIAVSKEHKILGYINEDPLYEEEYQAYIQANKSKIHHMYAVDVNDKKDFYSQIVNGIKISTHLKTLALNNAIRSKVELQYLKNMGVIPYSDYVEITQSMVKNNALRSAQHKQGKIIYGPLQYDKKMFISYLKSNALNKLREHKSRYFFNENEVLEYYSNAKDSEFSAIGTVTLSWFTLNNKKLPLNAFDNAKKLYERLIREKNTSFESHTFTAKSAKVDETIYPDIYSIAQDLTTKQGQYILIKNPETKVVYVERIANKVTKPLASVKHVIERTLFEKKYTQIVKTKVLDATVNVNQMLLEQIAI